MKYTRQLLEIDSNVATELEVLFESLDEGETVRIDGLEDKQVKKKLRHLLQALKLTPVGENGFKTADKKVAFAFLFTDCLRRAHEKNAAERPAPVLQEVVIDAEPVAKPKRDAVDSKFVSFRDADAGACGEEDGEVAQEAPRPPKVKKPRIKGPQLPGATIGAIDGGSSEEEKGESSDAEDHAGPKIKGAERMGVDLGALPAGSGRESWMIQADGSMGGVFSDAPGMKQGDQFEVGRSPAEIEAFEKAMKARGSSLMDMTMEGKFHREDGKKVVDGLQAMQKASDDLWGSSEKQQERQALGAAGAAGRKAFNPEEDMRMKKQMDPQAFAKFLEQSGGELAGKFSRGCGGGSFL